MGITHLWADLRQAGLVMELAGRESEREIAQTVDGLTIAVDVSIWMVQASLQPNLAEVFESPTARVLKVCFDRCLQWIRFGCFPVAVLEGDSPPEKQAELQRRFQLRGGGEGWSYNPDYDGQRGSALTGTNLAIANLFRSLGLPVIQAPGEAEAMCAALQREGYVDACATKDSDALVLGATHVFHTINLQVCPSGKNALQYCELSRVRAWLELEEGGGEALMVLAFLVGGDYHTGAERVGLRSAFAAVSHLLKGHKDDFQLMQQLEEAVNEFEPAALASIPKKCTGCRRCGHEGGRATQIKHHSKKNRCHCCPAPSTADVEAGFYCTPAAEGHTCQCAFHTQKGSRDFLKLLGKVRDSPGFLAGARQAVAAYKRQMRLAEGAIQGLLDSSHLQPGVKLGWKRRPDPERVVEAVQCHGSGLPWDLRAVEKKLVMILREWDACHPRQQGVVYVPKVIRKVAGSAADQGWAYVVDWHKHGKPDDEVSEPEFDAEGRLLRRANNGDLVEAHSQYPIDGHQEGTQVDSGEEGIFSQGLSSQLPGGKSAADLARAKKLASQNSQGRRYIRMSVIHRYWPGLVSAFEAKGQEKLALAAQKQQKRMEMEIRREAREAFMGSRRQTKMDAFLKASKRAGPTAAKGGKPADGGAPLLPPHQGMAGGQSGGGLDGGGDRSAAAQSTVPRGGAAVSSVPKAWPWRMAAATSAADTAAVGTSTVFQEQGAAVDTSQRHHKHLEAAPAVPQPERPGGPSAEPACRLDAAAAGVALAPTSPDPGRAEGGGRDGSGGAEVGTGHGGTQTTGAAQYPAAGRPQRPSQPIVLSPGSSASPKSVYSSPNAPRLPKSPSDISAQDRPPPMGAGRQPGSTHGSLAATEPPTPARAACDSQPAPPEAARSPDSVYGSPGASLASSPSPESPAGRRTSDTDPPLPVPTPARRDSPDGDSKAGPAFFSPLNSLRDSERGRDEVAQPSTHAAAVGCGGLNALPAGAEERVCLSHPSDALEQVHVSEGEKEAKEAKAGPRGDDEEAGGVHTGAGGDREGGGGHASPEDSGGEPHGDWDGEEMGGHCGYDYSDGWGYAGVSPAASSLYSGAVHPCQDLQATADSAPAAALSPERLEGEQKAADGGDVPPGPSLASPEKRSRSVSPSPSKGIQRVGGDVLGSPSKKLRTPGAAATPRESTPLLAVSRPHPATTSPPATGMSEESFRIFLSPDASPRATSPEAASKEGRLQSDGGHAKSQRRGASRTAPDVKPCKERLASVKHERPCPPAQEAPCLEKGSAVVDLTLSSSEGEDESEGRAQESIIDLTQL